MARIIMHIDLNAFFVSCELLRHPELKNKPIAVGGDFKRGVISTASYEARKKGIHSEMPIYQAMKLCPSLIILNGDYSYYKKMSDNFFSILTNTISPYIEMASIDEAYLDVTSILIKEENPYLYLKNLQLKLKNETGLGCSIGIGTTKFIAKMASDMHKPMGITIIHNHDIKKILFPLPIKDLYGVGKKTQIKLLKLDVKTIGDFYNYDENILRSILGKYYDELILCLEGKSSSEIEYIKPEAKSISSSSTFAYDTATYEEILNSIKYQVKDIVNQLQKKNLLTLTMHLTIRYFNFKTINRSKTVLKPLESENEILEQLITLFEQNWNGKEVRLIGVGLSNFVSKNNYYEQLNFFNIENVNNKCKTKLLINELNRKADKKIFMTLKDLERNTN